jgi:outer membrane protein assembly factor BamA
MSLVQVKIDVSSLASEHVIKFVELRFSIGLPVNWKSPIGRLRLNQVDQLSLIE